MDVEDWPATGTGTGYGADFGTLQILGTQNMVNSSYEEMEDSQELMDEVGCVGGGEGKVRKGLDRQISMVTNNSVSQF
jgi:hypothetical protein